jgi:hypothetical protein
MQPIAAHRYLGARDPRCDAFGSTPPPACGGSGRGTDLDLSVRTQPRPGDRYVSLMARTTASVRACALLTAAIGCGGDDAAMDPWASGTGSATTSSGADGGDDGPPGGDAPDADAEASGAISEGADGSSEASSAGPADPTGSGDDDEPHGEGMCGGGFGNPNGLGFVPPCPSDPLTFHARYNASRGDYYHDGDHVFEPKVVEWDDSLAALAQEYAEAYAGGMPPNGEQFWTPASSYDPYWDGEYAGYRAIAGAETPTSCTCTPPDFFGGSESYVFYNNSSAYFRAGVVRMDGVHRMGIGHVAPGDGAHYWTLLFAP